MKKPKGRRRERHSDMDPITSLLDLITKGRWRAKIMKKALLDQTLISEATWEEVQKGRRTLQERDVRAIADALDMHDSEYQQMMLLAGYREPLEVEIPVTRIAWAFRCYLDNPERSGVYFKKDEMDSIPLSIQAYVVMRYWDLAVSSLLREDEIQATGDWLIRRFQVVFGDGISGIKEDLDRILVHISEQVPVNQCARMRHLVVSVFESHPRRWVDGEMWYTDLHDYTSKGAYEPGVQDREDWLDDQVDEMIEAELRIQGAKAD